MAAILNVKGVCVQSRPPDGDGIYHLLRFHAYIYERCQMLQNIERNRTGSLPTGFRRIPY